MAHAAGIDIETTGLHWGARVLTIGVAKRNDAGDLVRDSINLGLQDLFIPTVGMAEARHWLQQHIAGVEWLTFHNATFDLPYLLRSQLVTPDEVRGRVFCTLVMSRATAGHDYVNLDSLVREYKIPHDKTLDDMKGKRDKLETVNPSRVLKYQEEDAAKSLLLFETIWPMAQAQYGVDWIREEGEFSRLISEMRVHGVPINLPYVRRMLAERQERLHEINRTLVLEHRIEGPFDTEHLAKKLRGAGIPVGKTAKGKPNLDDDKLNLISLNHPDWAPLIGLVQQGREIHKEISTWLQGFLDHADDQGFIHPLMSVGGTVSSRMSCTNPNAQAVKRGLKGIFMVDVEADYSQAELRLGAAYGGEDKMAVAFANDVDIHLATAIEMYGEQEGPAKRHNGKTANFSGFYGGGGRAIAEALGIPLEMGQHIANLWRKAYPNVRAMSNLAQTTWIKRGYLTLSHGKRLYASDDDRKRRPYKAFNQLVQGSVAAVIQRAMLTIERELPELRQVLQVHDDIKAVFQNVTRNEERTELAREMVRIMQEAAPAEVLQRTKPPIEMKVDYTIREVQDGQESKAGSEGTPGAHGLG